MNRGELVSDDLIIDLVKEEVASSNPDRLLLDGFPRTVGQAEALESQELPIDAAVNLKMYVIDKSHHLLSRRF